MKILPSIFDIRTLSTGSRINDNQAHVKERLVNFIHEDHVHERYYSRSALNSLMVHGRLWKWRPLYVVWWWSFCWPPLDIYIERSVHFGEIYSNWKNHACTTWRSPNLHMKKNLLFTDANENSAQGLNSYRRKIQSETLSPNKINEKQETLGHLNV